jgi:hypothetical protein
MLDGTKTVLGGWSRIQLLVSETLGIIFAVIGSGCLIDFRPCQNYNPNHKGGSRE